jgi:hypothetical protein
MAPTSVEERYRDWHLAPPQMSMYLVLAVLGFGAPVSSQEGTPTPHRIVRANVWFVVTVGILVGILCEGHLL